METYKLQEERDYVAQNKDILRQKYDGDVIAVSGTEVIASGKSRDEVIKQVAKEFGKIPVLVGTIDDIFDVPEMATPLSD